MAGNYVPTPNERNLIDRCVRGFEESFSTHQSFVRMYEARERAYQGILRNVSDAAAWKHKLHPPYAFNLLETIVSNHVEMGMRFDVRPSPHSQVGLDEAIQMLNQAEAVEDLLRHEHRVDDMDEKQHPLYLTAAIGGRGVGKSYWNYQERPQTRQVTQYTDIYDHEENFLGTVPSVTEVEEQSVWRDHSTFEVIDPRDFIVHESARALQPTDPGGAQAVYHRCWYSYEQLKTMERGGYVKNVDFLKEARGQATSDYTNRDTTVYALNRTKDMIEVLECWWYEDGLVQRVLIGNRSVLLRDAAVAGVGRPGQPEPSPFHHGEYPFIICSSQPQPFSTIGKSDVELIEQLQELLWELMNQRLDNIELINNAIVLLADDVEDPEAYEHYPGARWMTQRPDQVQYLAPPYQVGELSVHAEALAKGDIQNVTSAAPFSSGAESATVDQKTATGASIVMNAAQARMMAKKWQAQRSIVREANMRIKNCQQFLDGPKLAHRVGHDGAMTFTQIDPDAIRGEWLVELNPESDSNMRQERRAEATQFFQVALAAAPVMAASQTPLNLNELFKWWGKKWDIIEVERFLSQQPAALGAAGQQGGAAGAPVPGDPQGLPPGMLPNLGVTAPAAPGAQVGASPITALQRALAMGGGSSNAPGIAGR